MSEDDTQRGPERPMLILGDDLPDVEDTTPEELRRQQEEARREIERQRRELQEEIERRRREAEREIAEMEAQKERELRERERDLERTQKKLYRRESRLLSTVRRKGRPVPERLVQRPARPPLRERGLRRSGLGVCLGLVAALGIGVAGTAAGTGSDPETAAELEAMDRAMVLHMRSGLTADEVVAARMAGQPLPSAEDGSVPGEAFVDEAVALAPDSRRYGERTLERIEQVADEQTGTVRALTLWSQARDEAGYAVGSWDVADLREEAADEGAGPLVLGIVGLVALLVLLAMAVAVKAWVAVPVLLVATVLGVGVLPAAATGVTNGVGQAAEDHDVASEALEDVYEQVGRDLEAAYGVSTSSYAGLPEYWVEDPFYDIPEPGTLQDYLRAREAVGEADGDEATYAAAADLAATGRTAFEARVPAVEETRARILDGLAGSGDRAWPVLLGLGAAALVVAGVAVSGGRREGR
ncbi:hypothetical protein [Ornithinimicrobium pekingense]|uniref:hypothetical protein n=1 Tax=Ornithinimicrobium pekingense TaxID=384677 RepID=UPI0003B67EF6|nr:hypothetical protein [Ornithinimicrobium pekingense]